MKVVVVNTEELLALAYDAGKHGFNRQLDESRLHTDVDPYGLHVLSLAMFHDKSGTVPHVRATVFMKVKNQSEPVRTWLDVAVETWDELPDYDDEASS